MKDLLYFYNIELNFNIINPNRVILKDDTNLRIEVSYNFIKWSLILRLIKILEFSFWNWNKILLEFSFITLIISLTNIVRFFRYQIGSNLSETSPNKL